MNNLEYTQSKAHQLTRWKELIAGFGLIIALLLSTVSCERAKDRLIQCIASGNRECVEHCIKDGIDLNFTDSRIGMTPLMWAILTNREDIVRLLVKSGANARKVDVCGRSTAYYACDIGNVKILRLMVKEGVNLAANDVIRDTMRAARKGYLNILNYLVSKGVPMNYEPPKTRYGSEYTFMMSACAGGHVEIVEWLLQNGATLTVTGFAGNTPLLEATRNGFTPLVHFLLKQGARPNDRNDLGETALLIAAQKGYVEITKLLLENGADPNLTDDDGRTPLMLACGETGNLAVVRFLVSHGASVLKKDKYGKTALYYAKENGNLKVVEYLNSNSPDTHSLSFDFP